MRVLSIVALLALVAPTSTTQHRVVVLELRDSIQPASLQYVERGLQHAAEIGASLVVIELDTPGGLLVSLRSMISVILRSPTPVAVYVTPAGARAASAGFFLLLAADVAAMAPGTNTGAAHPVGIGTGKKGDDDDKRDVESEKATEDAAAFARALAAQRGRSIEWAEHAVRESRAYSADEALRYGLIDTIATSRDGLLVALDGTTVKRSDGSTQRLATRNAQIDTLDRTLSERVLSVVADPQIAYLLLMLGVLGILIEVTNPGLFAPGIVGLVAVLVALYGLSVVPVNWVGALLIVTGLVLVAVEVVVTSHGLLGVGGIASFVIGSLMLVRSSEPDLQIGLAVVLPIAALLVSAIVLLTAGAIRSHRLRPQSGIEAMRGEIGEVVLGVEREHPGTVFVHGEYWTATADDSLPAGAKVRVDHVDGHRLHVAAVAERQGAIP